MSYANIILLACLIFPFIAAFITIPYIIHQYHKYGSLPPIKVLIAYSFILYLLVSYFLVILPLPSIATVREMTSPLAQLIPFKFIYDIITNSPKNIHFFTSHDVTQAVYNIILIIPFGVYLRYFFKLDLKKVIKYSFFLSLFFELTQLSGLYFIYPRAYRLFDIDDLIINTLGGILGFYLTKHFTFFLPTRNELELLSYTEGTKVSLLKRTTSNCLDIIFMLIMLIPVSLLTHLISSSISYIINIIIVLIIYYMIIPIISKGYTLGKKIVNLRIMTLDGKQCEWYQYIVRYTILFIVLLAIPHITVTLYLGLNTVLTESLLLIFFITYFFIIFLLFIYMAINNIFLKKPFLYERMSESHNVSTIVVPEILSEESLSEY